MRYRIRIDEIADSGVVTDGRTVCTTEEHAPGDRVDSESIGLALGLAVAFLPRPCHVLAYAIDMQPSFAEQEYELADAARKTIDAWQERDSLYGIE